MKLSYLGGFALLASLSAAAADNCVTLNSARIAAEGGNAFATWNMSDASKGDSNSAPRKSALKLYENGKALGAAHSRHADIESSGKGRFSHWGSSLYFSSSDNSDPRKNKRTYSYCLDGSSPSPVATPAPTPVVTATPKPSPTASPKPSPTATVTPKPSPAPTPVVTATPPPVGNPALSGLMGYAMMDGGTTGGAGGPTVTVKTLSELASAVSGNSARIVKVSGVITGGDTYVSVGSNKSIIGLPGAEIHAIGLYMFGVSNIIIQNLKLYDGNPTVANGGTGYSTFAIKDNSHHVWVDHVEMYPSDNRDNGHTMASVTKESKNVTISWSSLSNKYTGFLVGSGGAEKSGEITVTIHHCLFDRMLERQPKAQNGSNIHMLNNYFRNALSEGHTAYGITSTAGSQIRTDSNYFENFSGVAIATRYNPADETDGFIGGAETNYRDSSKAIVTLTTPASNWKPPYDYSAYLTPVMSVPDVVMSGVGATLK